MMDLKTWTSDVNKIEMDSQLIGGQCHVGLFWLSTWGGGGSDPMIDTNGLFYFASNASVT